MLSSDSSENTAPDGSNMRSAATGEPLVGAIDGGGTKTVCLLATADGTVIGAGRGGPLNALFVSADEAIHSVRQAALGALRAAYMEQAYIAVLYASAPGASPGIISAGIAGLIMPEKLEVEGDEIAVLTGALVDDPGVVVLAGTGSFAIGRGRGFGDVHDRSARGIVTRGGWGPLLGDEGSAYAIGLAALRAVALACDGRGERTVLSELALSRFNAPNARALATTSISREQIASFAVQVSKASRVGDAVASAILTQAGRDLGKLGVSVLRELGGRRSGDELGTSAVLTGGVSRAAKPLAEAFRAEIMSFSPEVQVVPPRYSPAGGALLAALEMAGLREVGEVPAGMQASAPARPELCL
jgi:N-acetylglucosamine kinase-like BadF-type ATPase